MQPTKRWKNEKKTFVFKTQTKSTLILFPNSSETVSSKTLVDMKIPKWTENLLWKLRRYVFPPTMTISGVNPKIPQQVTWWEGRRRVAVYRQYSDSRAEITVGDDYGAKNHTIELTLDRNAPALLVRLRPELK